MGFHLLGEVNQVLLELLLLQPKSGLKPRFIVGRGNLLDLHLPLLLLLVDIKLVRILLEQVLGGLV